MFALQQWTVQLVRLFIHDDLDYPGVDSLPARGDCKGSLSVVEEGFALIWAVAGRGTLMGGGR